MDFGQLRTIEELPHFVEGSEDVLGVILMVLFPEIVKQVLLSMEARKAEHRVLK